MIDVNGVGIIECITCKGNGCVSGVGMHCCKLVWSYLVEN